MKIIRPFNPSTSGFAPVGHWASTAPLATTSATPSYSSGTTYALGDLVRNSAPGSTTGLFAIYSSLQSGNLGNSPTYGANTAWWKYEGDSYLNWQSATTYTLGFRVTDAAGESVYESLQASNLNHAVTDPAWWVKIGPTNKWAPFDQVVGTVTTVPNQLTITIKPSTWMLNGVLQGMTRCDSVALLNVSASSVRIQVSTVADGVIYDRTSSLIDSGGITDWYAYFYEDARYLGDFTALDLPPATSATFTITLANTGGVVSVGTVIVGQQRDLGATQYGASIGITDYSKKEADEFGSYTIVERAYSKRGRFTLQTANERVPALIDIAAQYRATPVVWVGADSMAFTALYGFYKDFNVEIAYPTTSICTLDIEGLT